MRIRRPFDKPLRSGKWVVGAFCCPFQPIDHRGREAGESESSAQSFGSEERLRQYRAYRRGIGRLVQGSIQPADNLGQARRRNTPLISEVRPVYVVQFRLQPLQRPRRAVALLRTDHEPTAFETPGQQHGLDIVYTVHTDTAAVPAALIAVQYALEHLADAVAIPHLGTLESDTPWWVVTEVADLITGTQECPVGSASPMAVRQEP